MMDSTLIFLKFYGFMFIILGFSLTLNRNYYQEFIEEFVKSPGIRFFSSFFLFVLGSFFVLYHPHWGELFEEKLVTALNWMFVLKGSVRLLFPYISIRSAQMLGNAMFFQAVSIIYILVGIWFIYRVYF